MYHSFTENKYAVERKQFPYIWFIQHGRTIYTTKDKTIL